MLSLMYLETLHLWMLLMQLIMYRSLQEKSASIIFGAMYDDTKSDECTITVIATGLHNVGGSASKLKARLEGQQKTSSTSSEWCRKSCKTIL